MNQTSLGHCEALGKKTAELCRVKVDWPVRSHFLHLCLWSPNLTVHLAYLEYAEAVETYAELQRSGAPEHIYGVLSNGILGEKNKPSQ